MAHGGVREPAGIWQLDGDFYGTLPSHAPLNPSTLVAGADYSFGMEGGYRFLQTQPFFPSSKRLVVTNPTGANGGSTAVFTNQWTVVMDVKFDAFQPYSGILQLNPLNNTDVSIYLFSSNGVTARFNSGLGSADAVAVNTWYRIAFTCGNNGAGGPLTTKVYINGELNGTPRTTAFDGELSLKSTLLLFSDNNADGGDLKPAKLGSFGLWGEELSAADIASLGGPRPGGLPAPLPAGTIATAAPLAYGANVGWIHGKPAVDGLAIGDYACSGFGHAANAGWINFGRYPLNGIRHSNTDGTDSGVNHDGAGNLSGLAWGANIGWINFGTDAAGSPHPLSNPNRPRVDLLTGNFSGYAYGANVGWISLSGLRTTKFHVNDADNDGLADAWEREKFGNLTTANATTDTDQDGISDKDEYLADTDPQDAASRLRIVSHAVSFFPGEGYNSWNVTFTSSPRRVYRIETSADLGMSFPWDISGGLFPGSPGSTTTRNLDIQPGPKHFLRVRSLTPLQP